MKVSIDNNLVKALKIALEQNGYDAPETWSEWSQLFNDLIREKIEEDFGSIELLVRE